MRLPDRLRPISASLRARSVLRITGLAGPRWRVLLTLLLVSLLVPVAEPVGDKVHVNLGFPRAVYSSFLTVTGSLARAGTEQTTSDSRLGKQSDVADKKDIGPSNGDGWYDKGVCLDMSAEHEKLLPLPLLHESEHSGTHLVCDDDGAEAREPAGNPPLSYLGVFNVSELSHTRAVPAPSASFVGQVTDAVDGDTCDVAVEAGVLGDTRRDLVEKCPWWDLSQHGADPGPLVADEACESSDEILTSLPPSDMDTSTNITQSIVGNVTEEALEPGINPTPPDTPGAQPTSAPPLRQNKTHATQDIVPLQEFKKSFAEKLTAVRAEAEEQKRVEEALERERTGRASERTVVDEGAPEESDKQASAETPGSGQQRVVPSNGQKPKVTEVDASLNSEGVKETSTEEASMDSTSNEDKSTGDEDSDEDRAVIERYNYASKSNGAKVVANNKEAKHTLSILNTDQDTYMITPCGAEKWFVVVELSGETYVDSITLCNYEFYSGSVKEFVALGSSEYPATSWVPLGEFVATSSRGAQEFKAQPAWVRFVKLRITSHHSDEHYCTLSEVRVHGKDVVESFKQEMELIDQEVEQMRTSVFQSSQPSARPAAVPDAAPSQAAPAPAPASAAALSEPPSAGPPAGSAPEDPDAPQESIPARDIALHAAASTPPLATHTSAASTSASDSASVEELPRVQDVGSDPGPVGTADALETEPVVVTTSAAPGNSKPGIEEDGDEGRHSGGRDAGSEDERSQDKQAGAQTTAAKDSQESTEEKQTPGGKEAIGADRARGLEVHGSDESSEAGANAAEAVVKGKRGGMREGMREVYEHLIQEVKEHFLEQGDAEKHADREPFEGSKSDVGVSTETSVEALESGQATRGTAQVQEKHGAGSSINTRNDSSPPEPGAAAAESQGEAHPKAGKHQGGHERESASDNSHVSSRSTTVVDLEEGPADAAEQHLAANEVAGQPISISILSSQLAAEGTPSSDALTVPRAAESTASAGNPDSPAGPQPDRPSSLEMPLTSPPLVTTPPTADIHTTTHSSETTDAPASYPIVVDPSTVPYPESTRDHYTIAEEPLMPAVDSPLPAPASPAVLPPADPTTVPPTSAATAAETAPVVAAPIPAVPNVGELLNAGLGLGMSTGGVGGGASAPSTQIFKILTGKIKSLELNQSLLEQYVEDLNRKYLAHLSDVDRDMTSMEETLLDTGKEVQAAVAEAEARFEQRLQAALDAADARWEAAMSSRVLPLMDRLEATDLRLRRVQRWELAAAALVAVLLGMLLMGWGKMRRFGMTKLFVVALAAGNGVVGLCLLSALLEV